MGDRHRVIKGEGFEGKGGISFLLIVSDCLLTLVPSPLAESEFAALQPKRIQYLTG